VIGNIARLTPWKGQRYLLEAFSRVAVAFPSARLVFAGSALFESDAFEQSLRRLAADLGLADRVFFLGYRRDVQRLLAGMDVFAYTALEKDTGPLSVLEAMASEVPVVGFDIPGVRMFVSRDEEGLLVPVGETNHLARALATVLGDPELRRRIGRAARQRTQSALSLDRHVQHFEDLFRELIDRPPHPGRG
jgi:glycosyltransferase involved in cell wall biosynthesis